MSHKYCGQGLNLGSATMADSEQSRWKTCLAKYTQSYQLFEEEHGIHLRQIAAIENVGGDKFAKFNEYDRY